MKAAWYERNGPARSVLTVGDLPDPTPGPGEVLVRMKVSGVNPSDVKSRAGARGGMAFPKIVPHSDGAGMIEAVGPGVEPRRIGERVWLWNGQWRRPWGTAAELIALPAAQAVRLPDGVSFEAGACLGIPAMTAEACLFSDGPLADKTVLVTGGAGAVGHYAIQLAKWGGARVIATAGRRESIAACREAGADLVIDYKRERVAELVMEASGGAGVDRVVEVEFGGNLETSLAVVKENGTIAAYASMAAPAPTLPFYPLMFKAVTLRLVLVYILTPEARRRAIANLTAALAAGALTHPIAARVPLVEIAAAHEAVEAGNKLGQVLVALD
ncbi:MAG TPA: NADPH:quinone reductase [Alphaproteobacteria bacterium]|nr:NADPH:quinone reductase [Alphaproteobacteria bacterium]